MLIVADVIVSVHNRIVIFDIDVVTAHKSIVSTNNVNVSTNNVVATVNDGIATNNKGIVSVNKRIVTADNAIVIADNAIVTAAGRVIFADYAVRRDKIVIDSEKSSEYEAGFNFNFFDTDEYSNLRAGNAAA